MKKFIEELKRRNVIKATIAYLVVAWILQQVFTNLLPLVDAPDWILKTITLILIIGLPVWIIVSWIYDITPKGVEKTTKDPEKQIKRELTNRRLNVFIIVSLSIAVIVMGLKITDVFSKDEKRTSIAVLPFVTIKVDENYEWLSEGFTNSVNSYLSKVHNLAVTNSHSSRKYRNSMKSIAEIGKELNVTHLLIGTVIQVRNKLNISVELIDVNSNKDIWTESYEESFEDDLLKLQQDVSKKIVKQLNIELSTEEEESLEKFPTKNIEAFKLFTKGELIADKRTLKDRDSILAISVDLFQKAIDLDPNYADAYAELAHVLRLINEDHEYFNNIDKFKKINSLLNKSLRINPNTVRVYSTLGMINQDQQKWEKAKENHEKALELKPNDATNHHYYAIYFSNKPNPDIQKSLEHYMLAYKLNPFSIPINANIINTLLSLEMILEAEEFYKRNIAIFKDEKIKIQLMIFKARLRKECIENKNWSEAISIFQREIKSDTTNSILVRELALTYNEILNDKINYLKNAKKAYKLGVLYSQNIYNNFWSRNGNIYFSSLLKNKKFKEANKLLQDEYFKSLFSKQALYKLEFYYYYNQENYSRAQASLDSYIFNKDFEQCLNYAQLNNVKGVYTIFNNSELKAFQKAIMFAIIKERDSMYYYINKEDDIYNLCFLNGLIEVDPYRKDERYKEYLQNNYLPITHWN